ncbi:NAD(P)-dependent oxidoreductase [Desulfovibrio sp. Huiquan2017]|uniref:NAD(P)-dependent oxidoreductase n=1 Tax=Desulfovibrio sp. Huiquan2017 TaxID=2816861 RepID=UPI00336A447F
MEPGVGGGRVLPEADALLVRNLPMPRELLALAPRLRVVSQFGVGSDKVDWQYLTSRNIPLLMTTGSNSVAVAEHAVMLMMAMAKDLGAAQKAVTDDWLWRDKHTALNLNGRTMLVIGFGNSGRLMAKLCVAFGMRVIAFSRSLDKSPIPGVELTKDFRAALPEADFISLLVPYTPETHHMLSWEDMQRLKPGAFLINVGRGKLLDETVVLKALDQGFLGGVGLDVFETEPPAPDSPLLRHPRSFFTPHIAGMTLESMTQMSVMSAQNLLDALDGKIDDRMVFNKDVLRK